MYSLLTVYISHSYLENGFVIVQDSADNEITAEYFYLAILCILSSMAILKLFMGIFSVVQC